MFIAFCHEKILLRLSSLLHTDGGVGGWWGEC